ncbi:nuclear transport factor 2 family protein [Nocardioides sp. AE5]|uniref:nuclear transport factor 2 family protein n=1 Tax=Nocardioides sp. AE5 TaxID=2962573 RepID=UPI002882BC16|nr:nuclear transport factor 2 family protein [Nocardioides sp. AE5]MDT0200498.1 nuclear transport factor 2 family protein [Nocardioides sp. AE5]
MSDDVLARLDAIEQIKALKYRYVRCLDTKQWDDFADCLLPETTGAYAGLDFADRESLVAFMRKNMDESMVSLHQVHHPEIEVDLEAGTATGRWYLQDKVMIEKYSYVLEGAAFYTDRYVRTPDGWRIAHTGYERTYEVEMSTKDLPNWKLKVKPTH